MDTKTALIGLEQQFWRAAGDPDVYARHLADDALHVLPGWGIEERDPVLEGVAGASPWTTFSIDEPRLLAIDENAAALLYTARAERARSGPYEAAITSVYRRTDGRWELVVHQQTPLTPEK